MFIRLDAVFAKRLQRKIDFDEIFINSLLAGQI